MAEQLADQAVREQALDVDRSFIVQAPAGSGKTGLLTQRYLALLSRVSAPEEIVAITFTRKAAAEMRDRILAALQRAQDDTPPGAAHEYRTWQLARAVLEQDARQGWSLRHNPARLRIMTFDSLCASLVRQMPVLSAFGAPPAVVEDASALYEDAARQTLARLEEASAVGHAIARLLEHLDNRHDLAAELIAGMLARRDQWLRHIAGCPDERREREALEAALGRIIVAALRRARAAFPDPLRNEFLSLLRFAAAKVPQDDPLARCRDLTDLPPASLDALPQWQALLGWLLKKDGDWRAAFTKAQGFPAKSSGANAAEKARFEDMKKRVKSLLAALQAQPEFVTSFMALATLPAPHYRDEQWQVLEALFDLLLQAVAHLSLVFQQSGEVDFAGIALAAVQALGEPDNPTDLALQLDYRIRHLLVDEFQDTSINQFELLRRLTAGWMPDDGRTLFLVGDPMQSIYRFREAEVGLFIEVRQNGLGDVRPEFLQLQVNFRSQKGIIDWVNDAFPHIFPPEDDEQAGAVRYSPSLANEPALPDAAVTILPFGPDADEAEAQDLVDIIRSILADDDTDRIAILVRSRTHLLHIVHALRANRIAFQAVDIDSLAERPVVRDLLSLTRALLHPADRIAWLSVLRAPFCGLVQADLHALAANHDRPLLECLLDERHADLDETGQRILARVVPVLSQAVAQRGRRPLRDWVEQTWWALGGPGCLHGTTDLDDAEAYLQLLETLEQAGDVNDYAALEQAVGELYARPDTASDIRVQLMTIHKAKGLEFDHVIVPGLGKTTRGDDRRLLYWLERPREAGESDLLFSPIPAPGDDHDPTVTFIKGLEKERDRYESQRLLYVAVTRARKRLYLSGHVKPDSQGEIRPQSGSLLELLWPVVAATFQERIAPAQNDEPVEPAEEPALPVTVADTLIRLHPTWQCPEPPSGVPVPLAEPPAVESEAIEFDWAGETARHVGTVVHRFIEHLARLPDAERAAFRPASQRAPIRSQLLQAGVMPDDLDTATGHVEQALERLLADPRGQWILSSAHQDAHNEYPLTGILNDMPRHFIVDRTFIDDTGTRWIIDYKTSRHEGGGLDEFLDREVERYRSQLETYARLFAQRESRPIRLGLYFPLLGGWRGWAWKPDHD